MKATARTYALLASVIGPTSDSALAPLDHGFHQREVEIVVEQKPRQWAKVRDLAEEFDVSQGLIHAEIKRGHLPAIRIGRRVLVDRLAVTRLLQAASPPDRAACPTSTQAH